MKKFLCFISVVALLVCAVVCAPDIKNIADDLIVKATSVDWEEFSAEELTQIGSKYKNHFKHLSQNQKKGYNNILSSILCSTEQLPNEIEVPFMTGEELTAVFEAVIYDNPTVSCFGSNCSIVTRGELCYFKPEYTMTLSQMKQKSDEIQSKITDIVSKIPSDSDEFEKELYIHDYIINNCTYDKELKDSSSTVYSCLIDGLAACEGYSKAAKLLLESVGIESYTLVGKATNSNNETQNHMWNVAKIYGDYYHLDITWDDPSGVGETVSHIYMNLTEQEIKLDHFDFNSDFECTATKANYYKKSGLLFDSFNKNDYNLLVKNLTKNALASNNRIEMKFTSGDAFNSAYKQLIINGSVYNIARKINKNNPTKLDEKKIEFIKDDEHNVLELIF